MKTIQRIGLTLVLVSGAVYGIPDAIRQLGGELELPAWLDNVATWTGGLGFAITTLLPKLADVWGSRKPEK